MTTFKCALCDTSFEGTVSEAELQQAREQGWDPVNDAVCNACCKVILTSGFRMFTLELMEDDAEHGIPQ